MAYNSLCDFILRIFYSFSEKLLLKGQLVYMTSGDGTDSTTKMQM